MKKLEKRIADIEAVVPKPRTEIDIADIERLIGQLDIHNIDFDLLDILEQRAWNNLYIPLLSDKSRKKLLDICTRLTLQLERAGFSHILERKK